MTYPIQPSDELVNQCMEMFRSGACFEAICRVSAQWGADQELEACCAHIRDYQWGFVDRPDGTKMHRAVDLEFARRPKQPSLKEQALALVNSNKPYLDDTAMDIIRRALEALPND